MIHGDDDCNNIEVLSFSDATAAVQQVRLLNVDRCQVGSEPDRIA